MTSQRKKAAYIFHKSAVMDCPYLENHEEQQLFTHLSGDGQGLYDDLTQVGFRRSYNIAYRPICNNCSSCIAVRIKVNAFQVTGSWQRILNKNADLNECDVGTSINDEQFQLFQSYLKTRHSDGEMASMGAHDYASLVLSSPVDTRLFEYRDANNSLKATCLLDFPHNGLSAVYSFFTPDEPKRSLGSFMILKMIEYARQHNLDYIYLGFWIKNSQNMAYKARFQPLEGFIDGKWRLIENLN